jgi:glycosyltransferase involved in cell wall biosynthesis
MPRVSVIIPAYNAEEHIGEALESIERQTYSDWEVVVGDDASTDSTAAIISGFGPRVRMVASQRNLGPANGRNLAIAQAAGELVATLDADDYWEPDYLEHQVTLYDTAVAEGRRPGVVTCNARFLLPDGRLHDRTYFEVFGAPQDVTLTGLLERNQVFGAALFPKAAVEEVGGFSIETWGSEDHDLVLRILEAGYEVLSTTRPLYVYRQGPETVSANLYGMARTNQATYRRALERGRLDRRQRRIARRQLRLQRAVEEVALIADERRRSRARSLARLVRDVPLFATVAAQHPSRWRSWRRTMSEAELGTRELRSGV